MENNFSNIRIEDKLKALAGFFGSSEVVFRSKEGQHIYPGHLGQGPRDVLPAKGRVQAETEKPDRRTTIDLQDGQLIFTLPSRSLDDGMLAFFCQELEEEINFSRLFDVICQAGAAISSNLDLHPLLHEVMRLVESIMNVEVTAVILLRPEKDTLYWEVSRGQGAELFEKKMTLPLGKGIAGRVAQSGQAMIVPDVVKDPEWCPDYDQISGFTTRSVLCVPVRFQGETLGVMEAINKRDGEFTSKDLKLLEIVAAQSAGAIENAKVYGELEEAYHELQVLDKAKERIINHLSHELGTPLSIINGVLERISRELEKQGISGLQNTIDRGRRNVSRLLDLQFKIQDIMNKKPIREKKLVCHLIEDALGFVQELSEEETVGKRLLDRVTERLESVFRTEATRIDEIEVSSFLDHVGDDVSETVKDRDLQLLRRFETGLMIRMDRNVFGKVCRGLLRNAIQNTPNEGIIEVKAEGKGSEVQILFRDYGIGISAENQRMIFGGFFHTQDTHCYASRKPYEFSAGGSGSDLLRMKVLSERFGFAIGFESTRCPFIPGDRDLCPGKISLCPHIRTPSQCLSSGGSNFWVRIPCAGERPLTP